MDNNEDIATLPDNATFYVSINTKTGGGVWEFELPKGSPLRQLFENQLIWTEATRKARNGK